MFIIKITINDGVYFGVGSHSHDDEQGGETLHWDAADSHTGDRTQGTGYR